MIRKAKASPLHTKFRPYARRIASGDIIPMGGTDMGWMSLWIHDSETHKHNKILHNTKGSIKIQQNQKKIRGGGTSKALVDGDKEGRIEI